MITKRAQVTIELAVLIGIVVAALVTMQLYMRRAISGKFKEGADYIGPQYSGTDTTTETNATAYIFSHERSGDEGYNAESVQISWQNGQTNVETFDHPDDP